MSYKIGWYIPDRVLFIRQPEVLTLELLQAHNRNAVQHLDQGTTPVHLITDLRDMKKFPINMTQLKPLLTLLAHPSLGCLVAITTNPAQRFAATALSHAMMRQAFSNAAVPSLAEAIAYLQRRDDTVDWSTADETLLEPDSESEAL